MLRLDFGQSLALGRRALAPDIQPEMTSPAPHDEQYPIDAHGFVRQCAWCCRIADAEGRYRLVAAKLMHGASHGCCEACAIRFLSRGPLAT